MMNNDLNVLDMARSYNNTNGDEMDIGDIFRRKPVSGNVKAESVITQPQPEPVVERQETEKKPWVPDQSLIDDMPELNSGPVIYDKGEYIQDGEVAELENIVDAEAKKGAVEAMGDMERKLYNIEEAKRRNGIFRLHIPHGEHEVRIMTAASDPNFDVAQKGIDEVFAEINSLYPGWIEYYPKENTENQESTQGNEIYHYENQISDNNPHNITAEQAGVSPVPDVPSQSITTHDEQEDLKIVIDKSQVSQISWSQEEADKIRKSRSIELNIVETKNIPYSAIEDADSNAIDRILDPYIRKTNDIVAALPASKYRATFTGLTFPEVIDLSSSQELNNIDGEYKKWSICFEHIKNPSIGPWESYVWYIDPQSGQKVKLPSMEAVPITIDRNIVHTVSKFEDFLMKTSFMDLEFMLWKILCATAMEKEIISITCHHLFSGSPCNKTYDWVYNPSDLLVLESINPAVLEEMKLTAEAAGTDAIISNYMSSMLNTDNTVELDNGMRVVFGHISAFDYLDHIYEQIKALEDAETPDPTMVSRSAIYSMLTVVKAFLVPKQDGTGWIRFKDINDMIRIIQNANEVNWQILSQITSMMVDPYTFQFAMRDIICPQCKNKSTIKIDSLTRLLFIVARSLATVQVVLKRT